VDKIILYQKDTRTFNFTIVRDGSPVSLSEHTPRFTAKEKAGSSFIWDNACTVTTASEGTCSGTVSSADTGTAYEIATGEVVLSSPQAHTRETLEQFYLTIRKAK